MVKLIIGNKGSGKTKELISMVNIAAESSNGSVICIEKNSNLTFNISSKARLLTTDSYGIAGADALFGFVAGICAGNYDITDIFIDATFKIIGRNYNELEALLIKLNDLSIVNNVDVILTLSCKQDDLPEKVHLGPWEQLIF